MLTKILSRQTCADCRICCAFDETDLWEAPLISHDLKNKILKLNPSQSFRPVKNSFVLEMEKSEDELYYCPMLSSNGCLLGNEKPFDCKIWPFRIMDFKGTLVITLSPVCNPLFSKPLNELHDFIQDGLADTLFKEAKEHPDIIKDYIPNYPILATL